MDDLDASEPRDASDDDARFVFEEWDRRARAGDVAGLLDLYTDDATLESPLVPRILNCANGSLVGREAIGTSLPKEPSAAPNPSCAGIARATTTGTAER